MSRVRVLQVLEATEGGTRTHLRDLVLGLDPERWQVDVAVGDRHDPGLADDLARFREHGVGVHVGPMIRPLRPIADLRAYRWLRGVIRAGGYAVVHAHSSKAGFLARAAAHREGVPVAVYTPNAFRFQDPTASGPELALVIALERLAARWGQAIICVAEGERRAALAARLTPPERLHVIPNGLDVNALDAQAAGATGREAMGVPETCLAVVTLGRRVPQKGDRYLLEAWPAVVAARPEARLVLIGDGPLRGELERQARSLGVAEQVVFVPRTSEPARLLAAADVFVLPSLYEGCPYSLLEAMALGRAAVATAVSGSEDAIEDGVTGLLVPPCEPEALAAALRRLLADPALRTRLGTAGRAEVRTRYRVEAMVEATAALYQRLLAEGGWSTAQA